MCANSFEQRLKKIIPQDHQFAQHFSNEPRPHENFFSLSLSPSRSRALSSLFSLSLSSLAAASANACCYCNRLLTTRSLKLWAFPKDNAKRPLIKCRNDDTACSRGRRLLHTPAQFTKLLFHPHPEKRSTTILPKIVADTTQTGPQQGSNKSNVSASAHK